MGVVIANGGPVNGLVRIGCLDLLRLVFGAVVLTSVVADEIGIHGSPVAAAARAGVEPSARPWPLFGSPSPTRELRAAISRSIPALKRVNAARLPWLCSGRRLG
jgi:hypothetical protein